MSDAPKRNFAPIERVDEATYRQLLHREKPHYDGGAAKLAYKQKKERQTAQAIAIAKALLEAN